MPGDPSVAGGGSLDSLNGSALVSVALGTTFGSLLLGRASDAAVAAKDAATAPLGLEACAAPGAIVEK